MKELKVEALPADVGILEKFWHNFLPFLEKLVIAILVTLVALIVLKILISFIGKALAKTKMDAIVSRYLITCLKAMVWIVVLISALSYLGVPVTSLIAVISAAGVAIALALQGSLSNLAGGILIILTKPFTKGDFIDNLSVRGEVEKINLMHTKLNTLDNKVIIIPNNNLINSTIINYTTSDLRRVDCVLSIAYGDSVETAKGILANLAAANPLILTDPPIIVGVKAHNASSVDLDFMVWCNTDDYWTVYYYIQERVLVEFPKAGLSIPYPQMDIHLNPQTQEQA